MLLIVYAQSYCVQYSSVTNKPFQSLHTQRL